MAYTDVKVTKVTSGNNYDISTHFTSGYTNTPSPYGTITITPKDGFTVENDLSVKVWVSYKSDGTDCGTKYFDFTIPGSGGGGGGSINVNPQFMSWTYNEYGSNKASGFTITKSGNVIIGTVSIDGQNSNKFNLETVTVGSSYKVYPTGGNNTEGDFTATVKIQYSVDGTSQTPRTISLKQYKNSGGGSGSITVTPAYRTWAYNETGDTYSQNFTITKNGSNVTINTISLEGESSSKFQLTVAANNESFTVYPKETNAKAFDYNAVAVVSYSVGDSPQEPKQVTLTQFKNGGSGDFVLNPPSNTAWEFNETNEVTYKYYVTGNYSFENTNYGGDEGSFIFEKNETTNPMTIKVRPAGVNESGVDKVAYIFFNYVKGDGTGVSKTISLNQHGSGGGSGEFEVYQTELAWEYNEETEKNVTYNKGSNGVIINSIFIDPSSDDGFVKVSQTNNKVVIKSTGINGTNEAFIGYLCFTYSMNGGPIQTKYVNLIKKSQNNSGYLTISPAERIWEYNETNSQDFIYSVGGNYSISNIALTGINRDLFTMVEGIGKVTITPNDVNEREYENNAKIEFTYSRGSGNLLTKYISLLQKNNTEWITFVPPAQLTWNANEYGEPSRKIFEIQKGSGITIKSIEFFNEAHEGKFYLLTGDTECYAYPLESNEGSTSDKISDLTINYTKRSTGTVNNTKSYRLKQFKDSSPKPPGI